MERLFYYSIYYNAFYVIIIISLYLLKLEQNNYELNMTLYNTSYYNVFRVNKET